MNFFHSVARGAHYAVRGLKKLGVKVSGGGVFVERGVLFVGGAELFGPCVISGKTVIGAGASVLPFCHIQNSVIGSGAEVRASTLADCEVGKNCKVGPYAFLRGGAKVGEGCRIGDFVEIKNSVLGAGCKAAHHAYIGDAEIGRDVNIGCGVVFANYDGKVKSRTVVEDGCFIGCNCNIVAPAHIGRGAFVAAGTTVTGDLAPLDFCIGRARPKVKPQGAAGRYKNG